jgi:hypothetical protein
MCCCRVNPARSTIWRAAADGSKLGQMAGKKRPRTVEQRLDTIERLLTEIMRELRPTYRTTAQQRSDKRMATINKRNAALIEAEWKANPEKRPAPEVFELVRRKMAEHAERESKRVRRR